MFRFETTIARVVNNEAGHKGGKNRVHDLIRTHLKESLKKT